jgi:hypothetical protein
VDPSSGDEDEDGDSEGAGQADSNVSEKKRSHEQAYIVKLHDNGEMLDVFSGEIQTDVMGEAVSYLIENYDLISKIEPLPYIPGREKAIINNQPTSPHNEEAMRGYQELAGGYYLDTHMNGPRKKSYMRKFADKCQTELTFEGKW